MKYYLGMLVFLGVLFALAIAFSPRVLEKDRWTKQEIIQIIQEYSAGGN